MTKIKLTNETELREAAEELAKLTGSVREAEAEMTARINAIRDSYAAETAELTGKCKTLMTAIEGYAKKHPEIFPNDKKTTAVGSVMIFKRITPPKVGIPTATTWEEAVERLREVGLSKYVRQIEEVNKESIIADVSTDDALRGELAKLGITVTQSEKYSIEVMEEQISK